MYSNIDLELIRIFGSKELTEGCIVQWTDMQGVVQNTKFLYKESEYYLVIYKGKYSERATAIEEFEILGHIPHLEDLFRVAEEMGWLYEMSTKTLTFFGKSEGPKFIPITPTIPLLEQSEETKQALITLFR